LSCANASLTTHVIEALREVAIQIKEINRDSTEVSPVVKLADNYFIVPTNDTLHPYLLQSLLANEFRARSILINFDYGIYDCFTNTMIFDGEVALSGSPSVRDGKEVELPLSPSDSHYFGVYFPEKETYLAGQMGVWLVSSGVLLLVFSFFAYTLAVISQTEAPVRDQERFHQQHDPRVQDAYQHHFRIERPAVVRGLGCQY
jgi:two-component system phosphate regulon sensor histidine kinase PhoR